MSKNGWIGVDFDGTLVTYDGWKGSTHIGEPIWPMINRVKDWLAEGKSVKIFTARAKDPVAIREIWLWSLFHFDKVLEVTNEKDYQMIELWDDRVVKVERNTGKILES